MAQLSAYLKATSPSELFVQVLRRYEHDYESERPALVGDTMRFLLASRRGLSEPELLDLLGDSSEPLPHAVWSHLHLAAEDGLVIRSGLIGFGHNHLRTAAEQLFLSSGSRNSGASSVGGIFPNASVRHP